MILLYSGTDWRLHSIELSSKKEGINLTLLQLYWSFFPSLGYLVAVAVCLSLPLIQDKYLSSSMANTTEFIDILTISQMDSGQLPYT